MRESLIPTLLMAPQCGFELPLVVRGGSLDGQCVDDLDDPPRISEQLRSELVTWNEAWDRWHSGNAGIDQREPWLQHGHELARQLAEELSAAGIQVRTAFSTAWPSRLAAPSRRGC